MVVRRVGFFRELRHGFPDGPSLLEACQKQEWPNYQLAAAYLRCGSTVATTGVMADDFIEPAHTAIAPLAVLTDGTWAWPADLAYYVEKYQCVLPSDFVGHMRSADWRPRSLSEEEVIRVGRQLRETPPESR